MSTALRPGQDGGRPIDTCPDRGGMEEAGASDRPAPGRRRRHLPLNITTVALVLGAALLHATWNALLKSGDDRLRSIVVMTSAAGVATLPALAALPGLPAAVWPLTVLSCVLHCGYNLLLVSAYGHGELGQVYPMREAGAGGVEPHEIGEVEVGRLPDQHRLRRKHRSEKVTTKGAPALRTRRPSRSTATGRSR